MEMAFGFEPKLTALQTAALPLGHAISFGTLSGIRTRTDGFLRPGPLPVGLRVLGYVVLLFIQHNDILYLNVQNR